MRLKKIVLLNLPLIPKIEVSLFTGISRFTRENESWEFVFNCEAYPAANKILEKIQWDGAIVRITDRKTRDFVKRLQKPAVNVSAWIKDTQIPTVRRDERQGGVSAAQHLMAKGLTRFGFLRRRGDAWFHSERYAGFFETLEQAHFPCDVYQQKESLKVKKENQRFQAWLRALPPPFGLLLSEDLGAQNVVDSCQEIGLSIPRDIALIGSINNLEVVNGTNPPLSCVQPDEEKVGYLAAEKLSKLMKGEPMKAEVISVPPLPVVERESTKVIALDDEAIRRAVDFILGNYTHPLTIDDIADSISISRATFYRRFLQAMHVTPHDYIQKLRVDKARELLHADDTVLLEQVALACGFTSRKHLKDSFIRLVGEPPSQWRTQHGNATEKQDSQQKPQS